MNTKRTVLNLFLVLVLLIGLVNAQEDFTATAKNSVELCPCSNQAYIVTVENTGTIAGSYKVLADEYMAEWVNFNPREFVLNPGQKGSFYVFVNSVCNVEGNYDLEIFITTNNGLTKVIKQVLEFSQCYDYSLEQGGVIEGADESIKFLEHEGSYSLCKDEQKTIPVLIKNIENFENKYRLFLDAPEWAVLNVDSASLGAKKSGIFLISLDTTNIGGEFDFKLNTISELGKVQRKKNIEVDVGECYALELELEQEKDVVCGGEDKSYDLLIKNTGTLRQDVNLAVDDLDWAGFEEPVLQPKPEDENNDSLNVLDNESNNLEIEPELMLSEKKVLQLNPGGEKTVELILNPADDADGNFEIIVHATPGNKTEFKTSDTLNVNVISKLDCYKADISTKTSITNFYSHELFFAKVKNEGIKKATYSVDLDGVSWIKASPKTLELNPGQVGNINLDVEPGNDVEPGTYGIKIYLESNDAIYSKNVDIILKKESESMKKFKETVKFYQYYIYLLVLIAVLIIVFRNQIKKTRVKIKKRYEKYKIQSERLKALRLARKEREEEKKKKEELEEKREEKEREKKFKIFFKKYKFGVYALLLIAIGIFLGQQNKLFHVKYLPIYIKNFFYGYLYYILMGIGVVVALFLLILLYNFIRKRKKRRKIKKMVKKAEKKAKRKEKWYSKTSYVIAVFAPIIILLVVFAYFNLFDSVKDFFVLYQYYFVLGLITLVAVILLVRFYKPLFKFLKE